MKRLLPLLLLLAALLPALPARCGNPPKVFVPAAPAPPPAFVPGGQAVRVVTVPGPQGAQGVPGISGVPVVTVQAAQYGAVGDGVHDDTAAIQAALNYAVAATDLNLPASHQRLALVLPPGVYRITSPLMIDRPGGIYAGVTVQGAGTSAQGQSLEGGTTIVQAGAAQDSVLEISRGSFRDICVRDLTLQMAADTAVGLHLATTQASRYLIQNVIVNAPPGCHGTGLRQDYGSGNANGESPLLINVNCYNLDTLFDFRSGQAFGTLMLACGGVINNGGTHIKVGIGDNGGYQITAIEYSGSSTRGPLPNTGIQVGAMSGHLLFLGGRVEQLDTALTVGGGSNGLTGHVTLSESHFDGMTAHAPALTGGGTSSQYFVRIRDCKFSTDTTTLPWTMAASLSDQCHVVLEGDLFERWASVTPNAKPATGAYPGTIVTDCWKFSSGTYMAPVTN